MEYIKQKLREEFKKQFHPFIAYRSSDADMVVTETGDIIQGAQQLENCENEIEDFWLSKLDTYADAKIAKMFDQEANRNRGMIKMRGKNGVGFIKKEELDN